MINVHRIPVEMADRVSTHLVRLMKGLRANVFWVGLVTPVQKVVILLIMMAVLIIRNVIPLCLYFNHYDYHNSSFPGVYS